MVIKDSSNPSFSDQFVNEEHQAWENADPEEVHHVADPFVAGEGWRTAQAHRSGLSYLSLKIRNSFATNLAFKRNWLFYLATILIKYFIWLICYFSLKLVRIRICVKTTYVSQFFFFFFEVALKYHELRL